jgi:starch-binding outer membrane protein, SusD/RagB family
MSEMLNRDYRGCSNTGYFNRKYYGDQSLKNPIQPEYTYPIIRLAELYLNYAEAANEAYGPNTPAPGATMTAVQAINLVRRRINQPDIQSRFTLSKEAFRSRVKNEFNVEFNDEGKSFYDMRRWMDAPARMSATFYAMDIEKVLVSPQYPTGYIYTRKALDPTRQCSWKDYMYFLPVTVTDTYKMKNFDCVAW